ncbi:MAG: hypothetical protein UDN37_09865 [Bacteroidales bacterium]|jgi:hypothetical protein|nr:hypothetical protein [Bacteroidales bacterium]
MEVEELRVKLTAHPVEVLFAFIIIVIFIRILQRLEHIGIAIYVTVPATPS